MSYWTNVYGRFEIPRIDQDTANSLQKILESIFRKNKMISKYATIDSNTINGVQADNVINVLLQYQLDGTEEKFVVSYYDAYFLYSHDDKFYFNLPFLPPLPTGAETPLKVDVFFSSITKGHTAIIEGGLREFYSEKIPYITWWFETVCAMLNTCAIYSYNNYDTGEDITKAVFVESTEETRYNIIERYIKIIDEWHKIVNEYRSKITDIDSFKNIPDWQNFVLDYLKRKKQN